MKQEEELASLVSSLVSHLERQACMVRKGRRKKKLKPENEKQGQR